MKPNPRHDQLEAFSLGEARRLVNDLFKANPVIYWIDFLTTMAIGSAGFALISRTPRGSIWQVLAFTVCALAYYRATIFTHELVHLPSKKWKAFRAAWNLLCGVPFLMPSFTYYTHVDHHRRKHYGTKGDAEYIALGSMPPHQIVFYLMHCLVAWPLAVVRFGIISPITWVSPRFRELVAKHASSMIMDPTYIRPLPSARVRRVWRVQEALCFAWVVGITIVFLRGVIPISGAPLPGDFLPKMYLLSVAIMLINSIRTLAAHRFLGPNDEEMSFTEQLVDSINYSGHPISGPLWAPLGQRYHALHHLFPSIPYHNLGKAHARLLAALPESSAYRLTLSPSLGHSLRELWANARAATEAKEAATIENGPRDILEMPPGNFAEAAEQHENHGRSRAA